MQGGIKDLAFLPGHDIDHRARMDHEHRSLHRDLQAGEERNVQVPVGIVDLLDECPEDEHPVRVGVEEGAVRREEGIDACGGLRGQRVGVVKHVADLAVIQAGAEGQAIAEVQVDAPAEVPGISGIFRGLAGVGIERGLRARIGERAWAEPIAAIEVGRPDEVAGALGEFITMDVGLEFRLALLRHDRHSGFDRGRQGGQGG